MPKIIKNRSDAEMLAGFKEQLSFETDCHTEVKKQKDDEENFFTKELQSDLNKALLEQKVKLYKEGIGDYTLKVSCTDHQVVITAVPSKRQQ